MCRRYLFSQAEVTRAHLSAVRSRPGVEIEKPLRACGAVASG